MKKKTKTKAKKTKVDKDPPYNQFKLNSTKKIDEFCRNYLLNGRNGTKAAIAVGYKERGAHVAASRLLKNDKVLSRLKHFEDNIAEALEVGILEIAREYLAVGMSNLGALSGRWLTQEEFDSIPERDRAAIKKLSRVDKELGDQIVSMYQIETWDKLGGLKGYVDLCGFNAPVKSETKITDSSMTVDVNFKNMDTKEE